VGAGDSTARLAAYAALAAGVLAFSASGVLAKLCGAPAVTIAFWVRVASLATLGGAFLAQHRRESRRRLGVAFRHGFAGGAVFAVHILLYFEALKRTSVTVVFLLGALNPAVVGIAGVWLFGERVTWRQAAWTAVAIAAAVVVVRAPGASSLSGNLMAAAASLGYSVYFLISRHARRELGTLEYLTVATFTSLMLVGAIAVGGGLPLTVERPADVGWIALMGLVPGTVGHLTVGWALRHVEAHAAAIVLLAVPLFASLWAHLFVGEEVTALQLAAGLVVLASIPPAIRGTRAEAVPPAARALP
jgi:drug/metabolite transporter (DMT)-like permease